MQAEEELVGLEQDILREMLRLAELNHANSLPAADFEAATAAVRASLRHHAERIQWLVHLASMQDRLSDEEDMRSQVRRHRAESEALTASLRELAAKVRTDRVSRQAAERAALLAGKSERITSVSSGLDGRAHANAARNVTESLRRTRQLMASELQRTDATLRSLDEQGKSLKGTLGEQRGIQETLGTGRRKLNRLAQRETTDKVLIGCAFVFFVLVVLHIIKRRLGLALPMALVSSGDGPAGADEGAAHDVGGPTGIAAETPIDTAVQGTIGAATAALSGALEGTLRGMVPAAGVENAEVVEAVTPGEIADAGAADGATHRACGASADADACSSADYLPEQSEWMDAPPREETSASK